ncbi:MAG TPA: hypothetical protein VK814_07805 [Acidobacteriaceae bacterium]|nr:hypothetical protein [Acidobacteriaceae bacterium]
MSDENFTTPPPGPESNQQPAAEPAWGAPQPNFTQAGDPPPPPPPGYTQTAYPPPPPPGYVPPSAAAGLSDNAASALAYVTFIPAVIFLVLAPYNQKPVIKFHAIQELGLTLVGIILRMFWVVPFFGWVIGGICEVALLVVWVLCIVKASQGSVFKLPVIGDFAAQQSGYRI